MLASPHRNSEPGFSCRQVRRYTAPDEHAFFPHLLPPAALKPLDFAVLLHPCSVNLNKHIREVYLHKVLPAICDSGDDGQHGSAVVADVSVLQALSKRIHYGLFVAESKCASAARYDRIAALRAYGYTTASHAPKDAQIRSAPTARSPHTRDAAL